MWLKHAVDGIPVQDLAVSFNQMYRSYLIYFPGDINRYITKIANVEMGFGPRYLLEDKLQEVKEAYPVSVPVDVVQAESIEELKRPLKVLLGKIDWTAMNKKREERQNPHRVHTDEEIQNTVSDGMQSDKNEHTTGVEDSLHRINEHEHVHDTSI